MHCTPAEPLPALPPLDLCITTEVFEHLHDPIASLEATHKALKPSGFLYAGIHDLWPEFMHVSPDLSTCRDRLEMVRYDEVTPSLIFRKPAAD